MRAHQDESVGVIASPAQLATTSVSFAWFPLPQDARFALLPTDCSISGEAYYNTQPLGVHLDCGEIDIKRFPTKDKSGGVLYPAAQLVINKRGAASSFQLKSNAWKLVQH